LNADLFHHWLRRHALLPGALAVTALLAAVWVRDDPMDLPELALPVRTEARVLATEWVDVRMYRRRATEGTLVFRLSFVDDGGQRHEAIARVSDSVARATPPGSRVPILYDAQAPDQVLVVNHGITDAWLTRARMVMLIALAALLAAVWTLRDAWRELKGPGRAG